MTPLIDSNSATSRGQNSGNLLAWRKLYLSKAKLKATSRTSALLSGFAMIGMVEVNIDPNIPPGLLIAYAVITTLLVAVHLLALMISTCILPNLEAVSNTMSSVTDSPHEQMHCYIEMAWAFSTGFGILLFLAEIAILCWVKFEALGKPTPAASAAVSGTTTEVSGPYLGQKAAWASSAIVIPVCIIFIVFALHFYRKLVDHKYIQQDRNLRELQDLHSALHNV